MARVLGPVHTCAELLRSGAGSIWRRRRLRFTLLALLVLLPLLSGGWLWLRHSSLVGVRQVRVSGVHGPEAHAIDTALTNAARHMSTLDVHTGALRAAVAPFRIVRDVRVSTSFPHGLHIQVIEQPPVAALTVAGTRTAVAADGVVLGPALLSGSLPTVSAGGKSVGTRSVRDPALLGALSVLGAAPAPLAKTIERAYSGPKGLTVAISGGLLAYFGDGSRPHAKWLALASVLADPGSAGASYVDVRLPERPAAGFAPGTAPPSSTGAEQTGAESGEDLATGLAAAVGSDSSMPSEAAESESTGSTEASTEGGGEASGEESSEASSETPSAGG
jgi:cell division protein FtsQ